MPFITQSESYLAPPKWCHIMHMICYAGLFYSIQKKKIKQKKIAVNTQLMCWKMEDAKYEMTST